jgi:hypothetical protein
MKRLLEHKEEKMTANQHVLEWLLESDNPSVRFYTLKNLLSHAAQDGEVLQAKSAISQSEPARQLLENMHPEGYWLQKNPRTKALIGDGVLYGSFGTTHFCLAYLAELGLDRSHPQVEKAAERYLNLQQPDGDWLNHYSCLIGYNLRTFLLLGFRDDERVRRSLDLLLNTTRADGGYLCDWHEGKYKTREVKSCVRGAVKVLMAFAELPEIWNHPRCQELVGYFLHRGGIFRSTQPDELVNKDMARLSFPVIWRANSWEVLYALSKMGYGKDPRLDKAWSELEKKAEPDGRFRLDWTPTQCPWKVGKLGEVNKWLTYYVMAARKYAARRSPNEGSIIR